MFGEFIAGIRGFGGPENFTSPRCPQILAALIFDPETVDIR
jgi:hypothetical protein